MTQQRCALLLLLAALAAGSEPRAAAPRPLRLMPVGDSITRGTYLGQAVRDGQATGLPTPDGGGWRKVLQDQLRDAGVAYDFVGALNYMAYGQDGKCDKDFDPDHHGLAGFSNRGIRLGGAVPTPKDVLAALAVKAVVVPDIITVLKAQQPDVVLLMAGANGFDAKERDVLIETILANSAAHLIVATITPQAAPRPGWEKVGEYNASLPATVAKLKAAGRKISLVDMAAALTAEDLMPDGVHPNQRGLAKMADVWFRGLKDAGYVGKP